MLKMNSSSNKTINLSLGTSRSRKTSTTLSSASESSVFERGSNRKYSVALAETVSRINLQRRSVPDNRTDRKFSVGFPLTEFASKWRRPSRADEQEDEVRRNLLRHSKSDEALPKLKRQFSRWRVLQMVHNANRKLSNGDLNSERRKSSVFDVLKFVNFGKAEIQKRRMVRFWKQKAREKKNLLGKFRMAVKLTIFCARNFKEHCLRINDENDELAPFIKQLHFHEDTATDLLIDLTQFKANRQLRIPEDAKRILSKEVGERTENEIYSVTIALRNIKSIGDYPNRMQKKIAEVGLYEKYEAKRIIVRQGHPASGFYFILSGAVVVMVMDTESKYARPVAHLYKGQTFGELAIVNRTPRNSTVIAKETCEFLSISVKDYHKIFMAGGVKTVDDPDQEIFLKTLSYLSDWPTHILKDHPTKCKFLYFKRDEVITTDSHHLDWVVIVKSGSVQVLKKLKRCEAFEWRKKSGKPEPMTASEKREFGLQRSEWRRILPEINVPLNDPEEADDVILNNGRPEPFQHPGSGSNDQQHASVKKAPQIPNLWPFKVDLSEVEFGKYMEDELHFTRVVPSVQIIESSTREMNKDTQKEKPAKTFGSRLGVSTAIRRQSVLEEEEKELLGFQPHIRTIMEELDGLGVQEKDTPDPEDENPEFVHVQTLTKGQAFGLADMFIGDQPSFSVVSKGADCLLINKQFYQEHASEKLLREVRQNLCPFPSDEELQQGLQLSVDWNAFRKLTLDTSLKRLTQRRQMRNDLRGTKVLEAFSY